MHTYHFDGAYLQLGGLWVPDVPFALYDEILCFCNSWNKVCRLPKAFVETQDDAVWVRTEMQLLCRHGLTDHQMEAHLGVFIATSGDFFTELAETYPEVADTPADCDD